MALFKKEQSQSSSAISILKDLVDIFDLTGASVSTSFDKTFSLGSGSGTKKGNKSTSLKDSLALVKQRKFDIIKRQQELRQSITTGLQEYKTLGVELDKIDKVLNL